MKLRRTFYLCSQCLDFQNTGGFEGLHEYDDFEKRCTEIEEGVASLFGGEAFLSLTDGQDIDGELCDSCRSRGAISMCVGVFKHELTNKLSLGRVVATRAAQRVTGEQIEELILRHQSGDWGLVCADDWDANTRALKNGNRILSKYAVGDHELYIITEWNRSLTSVLLVNEY